MPAPNSNLSDLEKIRQSISSITSISSFDDVLAAVGLLDMPQGKFFLMISEGALQMMSLVLVYTHISMLYQLEYISIGTVCKYTN